MRDSRKCEQFWEALSAFASGQASAAQQERILRHVQACADCADELEVFLSATALLADCPEQDPPPGLRDDILRKTVGRSRVRQRAAQFSRLTLGTAAACAGVFLLSMLAAPPSPEEEFGLTPEPRALRTAGRDTSEGASAEAIPPARAPRIHAPSFRTLPVQPAARLTPSSRAPETMADPVPETPRVTAVAPVKPPPILVANTEPSVGLEGSWATPIRPEPEYEAVFLPEEPEGASTSLETDPEIAREDADALLDSYRSAPVVNVLP